MKRLTCFLCSAAAVLIMCSCAVSRGYVDVSDGGKVYYEERGKGPAVVLLHGHSLDRRMWDGQFKPLSEYCRVVRMDFRGYGKSSEQREDLQMTHADDVVALMDSLHIGQAAVVGLSMGAFVAGDMLAMYPDRLWACVMASGGIRGGKGPKEPMDSAESRRRDEEIAALKVKGVETMKREWTEQLIASGGSNRESMRKPLTKMIKDWTAWQPLHKEVRLFYASEAWQQLEKCRPQVPTLILRGAAEVKGKRGNPREMRFLDNARYVVLEDCGHMMNMEQPQLFNNTVKEFLKDAAFGLTK